jgi:hypothetical protein
LDRLHIYIDIVNLYSAFMHDVVRKCYALKVIGADLVFSKTKV